MDLFLIKMCGARGWCHMPFCTLLSCIMAWGIGYYVTVRIMVLVIMPKWLSWHWVLWHEDMVVLGIMSHWDYSIGYASGYHGVG